MIRGMQTLASAMRAQLDRQTVIAHNLENLSTVGFKQEKGAVDGFEATLGRVENGIARTRLQQLAATPVVGSLGVNTSIDRLSIDFRSGRLEETGQPLDVALAGDGFLEARAPDGDYFFRGGPLQLDADRRLVTSEGYPVLDVNGQEVLLDEGRVSIAGDGTISVDGQPATQLSVVEFDPGAQLAKVGNQFYTPDDPVATIPMVAMATTVKQGFLESSNVDPIGSMTEMVTLLRSYQATQRLLQAQDELQGKAINEIGRV